MKLKMDIDKLSSKGCVPTSSLVGEVASPILIGGLTGMMCGAMISPAWGIVGGMVMGMINGMLIQFLTLFVLMPLFGAFEIMIPCMLAGMLAGMLVGMFASIVPLYSLISLILGAGIGYLCFMWVDSKNSHFKGRVQ